MPRGKMGKVEGSKIIPALLTLFVVFAPIRIDIVGAESEFAPRLDLSLIENSSSLENIPLAARLLPSLYSNFLENLNTLENRLVKLQTSLGSREETDALKNFHLSVYDCTILK